MSLRRDGFDPIGKGQIMATVKDILASKPLGAQVVTIEPQANVLVAARRMNEHKIGALVVVDADTGKAVGIISERDVLQRVVADGRDPAATLVREVMTSPMACGRPDTTLDEIRTVMKERRIRHLPIVDGESKLHGLVSIGDLNAHDAHTQERTILFLEQYIHQRV
jgi:CBS domain-containing protein